MLQFVLKPLAWLGLILLCLVGWWFVLRLLFKAYYRSRIEFYQELKKKAKENGGNNEPV